LSEFAFLLIQAEEKVYFSKKFSNLNEMFFGFNYRLAMKSIFLFNLQ